MGKRLEDLHLTDQPLVRQAPVDPRSTEWYQFQQVIDDLLSTGEYDWAQETLSGIRETVERTEQVSQAQRNAVARIEASHQDRRRASRRYEGYRRG